LILIGSGFLLALFFLRHPKSDVDSLPVDQPRTPAQEAQVINTDDLSKIVTQAKSPHVSIEVTQAGAAEAPTSQNGKMSLNEFKTLTQTALKTLPKQAPRKDLTDEEAHHISVKKLKETESLGDIAQAVADNPALKKPAFDFYYQCASDEQNNLLWTVRSRCLTKLRVLGSQLGKNEAAQADQVANSVNPSIKQLSDFLPN
jgi:hypothetical protein